MARRCAIVLALLAAGCSSRASPDGGLGSDGALRDAAAKDAHSRGDSDGLGRPGDGSSADAGPVARWRSKLFPTNWVPVDEKQIVGVNVFEVPAGSPGTIDEHKQAVGPGHPAYHPVQFLHDFSYAGYRRGERAIPPLAQPDPLTGVKIFDVTKYGCTPSPKPALDGPDCRAPIQKAIDAAEAAGGGIVFLPPGEYRISTTNSAASLTVGASNVVIRGAGSALTFLKVDPRTAGGGFAMVDNEAIRFDPGNGMSGWSPQKVLAKIAKDVPLPSRTIVVDDVTPFFDAAAPGNVKATGREIVIQGYYTAAFLKEHDAQPEMWSSTTNSGRAYTYRRTVIAVDAAQKTLTLDVPTRYRIRTTDDPIVGTPLTPLREVGLERLAIGMVRHPAEWDFPCDDPADCRDNQSAGKYLYPILRENWRNYAVVMTNVEHGWIYDLKSYRPKENENRPTSNTMYGKYDVELLNHGVICWYCRHVTWRSFELRNSQVDRGNGNGYNLTLMASSEMLVEDGLVERVKKGLAFNREASTGNVIKDFTTRQIFWYQSDFHSHLSAANLVENNTLDSNYWEAAVRPLAGTNHGHGTTQTVFWNTRGASKPSVGIETFWERDNNNDGKADSPGVEDYGLIVSNQFGWGYVIGTYGAFSDVVTAAMPNRPYAGELYRPYILPRDYREGIGYDVAAETKGKALEPRSLYQAQLNRRRCGKESGC